LNVDITNDSRILIVKISGDIDHHTSEDIRMKAEKELSKLNCRDMIFDFTDVSFMDSSGIGMIIGRYKSLDKLGGKVAVSNINKSVFRIFEMSGLHKIIATFDTVEAAIKSLNVEI